MLAFLARQSATTIIPILLSNRLNAIPRYTTLKSENTVDYFSTSNTIDENKELKLFSQHPIIYLNEKFLPLQYNAVKNSFTFFEMLSIYYDLKLPKNLVLISHLTHTEKIKKEKINTIPLYYTEKTNKNSYIAPTITAMDFKAFKNLTSTKKQILIQTASLTNQQINHLIDKKKLHYNFKMDGSVLTDNVTNDFVWVSSKLFVKILNFIPNLFVFCPISNCPIFNTTRYFWNFEKQILIDKNNHVVWKLTEKNVEEITAKPDKKLFLETLKLDFNKLSFLQKQQKLDEIQLFFAIEELAVEQQNTCFGTTYNIFNYYKTIAKYVGFSVWKNNQTTDFNPFCDS